MTKPQDDSLWRPVRFKKPPRVGSTGGLSGVGFLGRQWCVVVWGRLRRPGRRGKALTGRGRGRRTTQGVPSPHNPSPAPTGPEPPPRRHEKSLPVKGTGGEGLFTEEKSQEYWPVV